MPKLDRSFYGTPTHEQLTGYLQRTTRVLDANISFGKTNANDKPNAPDASNIQCWKATGTTPVGANTEFAIAHNLPWIPWFYFYALDRAGSLYQLPATGTAWTAATNATQGNVYLKCSVASANFVVILI